MTWLGPVMQIQETEGEEEEKEFVVERLLWKRWCADAVAQRNRGLGGYLYLHCVYRSANLDVPRAEITFLLMFQWSSDLVSQPNRK